jgi:galactonate dehydratase
MKISRFETFVCGLGWRDIGFLKISTDDGLEGWSEFSDAFGSPGIQSVVDALEPYVQGRDPLRVELLVHDLNQMVSPARGGLNRQAIAAVENALLDIKGKAFGVPVAELFGGVVRDRVPLYWSHCGTYRARFAELMGVDPVRTYDDVVELGKLVRKLGFSAMKTNVLSLTDPDLQRRIVPWARPIGCATRAFDNRMIAEAQRTMAALREGAGDDADIFFDANVGYETEGYLRLEAALRPYRPAWLELDTPDPEALALLRSRGHTPIGSGETIYERTGYRPFFERRAVDVAIVDVLWNGWLESMKIAAQGHAYQTPVAPHNFYGHLATAISAHFSAAVPNLHIMEIDPDGVPWRDDITTPPRIENGVLVLPEGPGWGVEVNEDAIREHPSIASRPWTAA